MVHGLWLDDEMRDTFERKVLIRDGMHGRDRRAKAKALLSGNPTSGMVDAMVKRLEDLEFEKWAEKKKRDGFYNV